MHSVLKACCHVNKREHILLCMAFTREYLVFVLIDRCGPVRGNQQFPGVGISVSQQGTGGRYSAEIRGDFNIPKMWSPTCR